MAQKILRRVTSHTHWLSGKECWTPSPSVLANTVFLTCNNRSQATQYHSSNDTELPLFAPNNSLLPKCRILNLPHNWNQRYFSTEHREPVRSWREVTITQLMSMVASKEVQLFDVRTREEVRETGMIEGATNVPLSEIQEAFKQAPDEFEANYGIEMPSPGHFNIVLHCLGGVRSARAMAALNEVGFSWVRHYPAGWEEYEQLRDSKDFDAHKPWTDINYKDLMSMIKTKDIQLFDVRRTEEVETTGMMPGATSIPISEVEMAFQLSGSEFKARYGVDKPSKEDDNIIVHCLLGLRSLGALAVLHDLGFKRARHFPGGWREYSTAN